MYITSVNTEKCTGCEGCVAICPSGVFRMSAKKAEPFRSAWCVCCEGCLGVCRGNSITIMKY